MTQKLRDKGKEFAKFMESLSQDKIDDINKLQLKEAEEEYNRFKASFSDGNCYLCTKPLNSFSRKKPCLHWLLKPKGFKKNDFRVLSEKFGIFQIQSYLRWVANEEAFAKNINDLEGSDNKVIELTIKYKNIEWSFSCTESDFIGHAKSQHSKHPHYHFQMRVDKRSFISFNNFHLPLCEMDVINIEAMRSSPDKIKESYFFGEGMSDMFNEEVIEHVLNSDSSSENYGESPFSIDSRIMAKDGEKIDGGELYEIIQEAKEKGVTVASLMRKIKNADTQVTISPGPGVVEHTPRSKRKKHITSK